MTIGDLHQVLRRVGAELAPDELADVLWLAVLMSERTPAQSPEAGPEAVPAEARAPTAQVRPPAGPGRDGNTNGKAEVSSDRPEPAPRPSGSAPLSPPVRVSLSRGLPDALGLARALRPLRRQRASFNSVVLDEAATADRSAELRMWWPAYLPAPQRVIDLVLVVDTSASMALWDAMITELRLLCERLGVFRDVRVRYLAADGAPRPSLRGESPVLAEHEPGELLDRSGRRLVLVVTDGVHPRWHSGLFQQALARWASAGAIAIIQPLPQRLWDRTGLRPVVAEFHSAATADRSRMVHPRYQPARDEELDPPVAAAIPLLEVTPASFGRWAKLTVGVGPAEVPAAAVLVHPDAAGGTGRHPDLVASGYDRVPADASGRVRDFRASASPAAYRLAGLLSAVAPLSLPVMRLVQQVMGTGTGPAELAEVLLSGLLRQVTPPEDPAGNAEARYDFADGTREVLMATITRAQAVDLLRMTSAYLTKRHNHGRSFAAVPIGASVADIRDAAASSPSFAHIATMILDRLGRPAESQPPPASPRPIDEQIAAALDRRASQRTFVEDMSEVWDRLTKSFSALIVSAADLGAAAISGRRPDDAPLAGLVADLAELAPGGAWQRERAADVTEPIALTSEHVRVLRQRVHRDTVNIAVIGPAGAGKSTLLRRLSGLSEEVIPSNRYTMTTATPSRIFHEPSAGSGRAQLHLHTWDSFRAEVLEPLHELAMIPGPAPASVEEFRRFAGYRDPGVPVGQAGAERYRWRLRQAQDSLPSYQDLLRGGTQHVAFDELRPFIAYPDGNSAYRPYHAVRSVDIFCAFPDVGAAALGLVDIPGTGEAGLDVHRRFLADLRNNADVLYLVKRPTQGLADDLDWDTYQLADDVAAGVRRSDFVHQLINRDASLPADYFESAFARATADGVRLGVDVRVCDLQSAPPEEVTRAVLAPVLGMLAERLASMDRDAAAVVLARVTDTTERMRSLAGHLAQWIGRWLADLPDEERRDRDRTRRLRNMVGMQLIRIRDEYDGLYESGAPVPEVSEEIEKAAREMRSWLDDGMGAGSKQEWLETFQRADKGIEIGHELDRSYNAARSLAIKVFSRADLALARSVDRLLGEVADALRRELTEATVPAGPDNSAILSEFSDTAQARGARTIAEATRQLLSLHADCGSIFLRVGRPLISKIRWPSETPGPERKPGGAEDQEATGSPGAAWELTEASRWFTRLENTVELVSSEIERELRAEAQRTTRTLAAAVDLYIDAISVPGVEIEFEWLCEPVQRQIWPGDFVANATEVAAGLVALRQHTAELDLKASQMAALVDSAQSL